ncbi:hypothetical protein NL676_034404 [Syzygium grande]|nr:hypothetical protein NL676_034404 [Syzygium grande]
MDRRRFLRRSSTQALFFFAPASPTSSLRLLTPSPQTLSRQDLTLTSTDPSQIQLEYESSHCLNFSRSIRPSSGHTHVILGINDDDPPSDMIAWDADTLTKILSNASSGPSSRS